MSVQGRRETILRAALQGSECQRLEPGQAPCSMTLLELGSQQGARQALEEASRQAAESIVLAFAEQNRQMKRFSIERAAFFEVAHHGLE